MWLKTYGAGGADKTWRFSRLKAEAVVMFVPLSRPKAGRLGGQGGSVVTGEGVTVVGFGQE
jgi:hypothetical protein